MENSAPIKTPISTGIVSDFAIQIVVLNVDGSSPSGHPSKKNRKFPVNKGVSGFLV